MKGLKKAFNISPDEMKRIIRDFHLEMERGLSGRKSSLKMLPAYVDRPTGRETGSFIALDLGGTNFRVLELLLKGNGRMAVPAVMKFALKKQHITKSANVLFGFLASSVKTFLHATKHASAKRLNLGFTFSFPINQSAIAAGTLVTWTKGFEARGVIGHDVVSLLKQALAGEGLLQIDVTALANDTVGTLMARSYGDPRCDMGVIIGTGTNACYFEKISKIKKWKGAAARSGEMIINIEWGNFNKLKTTRYDRQLDRASDNPKRQILEKMVSGMYLGEVVRLVLKDLIRRKALFHGSVPRRLDKMGALKSEYVSVIESDRSASLSGVGSVLRQAGIRRSTTEDRRLVKDVCAIVSGRAARISAAAVAGVVTKMDAGLAKSHTVAFDGSVFEKHPRFSANMKNAFREIFGHKAAHISPVLSKDGSGKGAAIIAAVAAGRERR